MASNDNDNTDLVPTQIADRFYCPKDQLLLRFKSELRGYFCADCGTIYSRDSKKNVGTTPEQYSNNAGEPADPSLITMKFIPLGRKPDNGLSQDPDIAHNQLKGWVLIDSKIEAREEGTFAVDELKDERGRMLVNRNRNTKHGDNYTVH